MKMSARFSGCGGLLCLTFALTGAWACWKEVFPHNAWVIDEAERIMTVFVPRHQLDVSFRLYNAARVPLRILGASTC
jgi:hypothetical protein